MSKSHAIASIGQIGTDSSEDTSTEPATRRGHFNINVNVAMSDGINDMHSTVLCSVPFDADEKGFDRIIRERIIEQAKAEFNHELEASDIKLLFVVVL